MFKLSKKCLFKDHLNFWSLYTFFIDTECITISEITNAPKGL